MASDVLIERERRTLVTEEVDVLVVGGGTAPAAARGQTTRRVDVGAVQTALRDADVKL